MAALMSLAVDCAALLGALRLFGGVLLIVHRG